ncbi:hypothetical protein EYF80_006473 [Liparis tanakae]|uniref:Uncharacterized protein n=1 Tax=Liparis tanakae TaxID=230148 RepID=A0A4Z2J1Y3_9TELE|nr:hypothetical protein EYF80_006473 [Liparis tanakae]
MANETSDLLHDYYDDDSKDMYEVSSDDNSVPGSSSRRKASSSSSVMKPVLTSTCEPSLCTSSRLDPTMRASSRRGDRPPLLAQELRQRR